MRHVQDLYPPALPRYLSRDHLHDRNRINALYDPAQPGWETCVRVTRRRAPPETEAFLAREREERVRKWQRQEAVKTSEAHELLELRSMGVRAAIAASETANERGPATVKKDKERKPLSPPDARELRAGELHKKLGIDRVQLVTSPLFIDDTPQPAYPDPPASPAPAPVGASPPRQPTMRGAWPVHAKYFKAPHKSPSPRKPENEPPHLKGTSASPATRASTRASG